APPSLFTLTSFPLIICFFFSFQLSPLPRPPFRVKLFGGLNNPSPFRVEELHANGKAFALQGLAVGYSSRGAKLSGARGEPQRFARFPAAHTEHACAARTHVFRKCRFHSRRFAVPVDEHGNFHQNAFLRPMKREFGGEQHFEWSSSQARGNSREVLHAAPAAVLHDVQGAVGGAQKFFRRVAVFGKGSNAGAD